MPNFKNITLYLTLLALLGCAMQPPRTSVASSVALTQPRLRVQVEHPRELLRVNSVAVVPLFLEARTQVFEGSREALTNAIEGAAREELNLKVLAIPTRALGQLDTCEPLICGKRLGVDAVLVSRLSHFVPRQGSEVGVTVPASVGFELSLQRVQDGRGLWRVSYFIKDEALSENLFQLQAKLADPRGPRWRSERELFDLGIREALQHLAAQRIAQFAAG